VAGVLTCVLVITIRVLTSERHLHASLAGPILEKEWLEKSVKASQSLIHDLWGGLLAGLKPGEGGISYSCCIKKGKKFRVSQSCGQSGAGGLTPRGGNQGGIAWLQTPTPAAIRRFEDQGGTICQPFSGEWSNGCDGPIREEDHVKVKTAQLHIVVRAHRPSETILLFQRRDYHWEVPNHAHKSEFQRRAGLPANFGVIEKYQSRDQTQGQRRT